MIDQVARRIRENIQKVIVGKDEVIDLTLVAVLCEGHVLLEDVPGTGKTTLAKALAASLGCTFRRIQFTPDLLPSDVTGINYFNQKVQEFEFRPGPVLSQVVLAAEINDLIRQVRDVKVEESVQNYVVAVARRTRQHDEIALGASPRATLALYRTAQAWAAIHGSTFVTPDHVKFIAPYVLTHRIMI